MKTLMLAGVIAGLAAACALPALAAPMGGPLATVHTFMKAGASDDPADMKAAMATCAPDAVMVDEFAPHVWSGADACQRWATGFGAWMKAQHITNDKVALGSVLRNETTGDAAYVVLSATETYDQDGKPMVENGRMAFALRHTGGAWKVTGATWAGARPHSTATASAAPMAKPSK